MNTIALRFPTNEMEWEIDILITITFTLTITGILWVWGLHVRRQSGFITSKELKQRTVKKEKEIETLPLRVLNDYKLYLELGLENARKVFEGAHVQSPVQLAFFSLITTGWGEPKRRINLERADVYNNYMLLHDCLSMVKRRIRDHSDQWSVPDSVESSSQAIQPAGAEKGSRRYTDGELARDYLDYVKKMKKTNPTQLELGNATSISQPTWYRAFQRRAFWGAVKIEMDKVFATLKANESEEKSNKELFSGVYRDIADKMERRGQDAWERKTIEAKRAEDQVGLTEKLISDHVDGSDAKRDKKILHDSERESMDVTERAEIAQINTLSDKELVSEILKHQPKVDRKQLELRTTEELRTLLQLIESG